MHQMAPGQEVQTPFGAFYLSHALFPADYVHGRERLADLLTVDQSGLRRFLQPSLGQGFDLRQAIYLDTETTGLSGGVGTYAFLIGIGFFEGQQFRIQQYFMRDYHEERPLLHHLSQAAGDAAAVVTFNGRAFDLPLVQTRLVASRLTPLFVDTPHLDLLPPSRRLWRARVGSCSLGSLEEQVLGVRRSGEDVPGWLIPSLYFRYLQTGDARQMVSVLYHNAQDILSMVTLASILSRSLAQPAGAVEHELDRCSLGRWCEAQARPHEAEALYREALAGPLPLAERRRTMAQLATLLKRQDRRGEAVELWLTLADDPEWGLTALEELAKWGEWHSGDLQAAARWTEQALAWVAQHWRGPRRRQAEADLRHRLERLQAKLGAASPAP
ncbi:MAG: tetratricopeptide repeat protein [Chloroflexi bacterium]|nr:tetratricopeptide repeat protein [Chloroflexota bacterium]